MSGSLKKFKMQADAPGQRKTFLVSNKGRVQLREGVKTYGTRDSRNYMRCGGKYSVHDLVLHAFVGPRPTSEHTADHRCNTFDGRSNNSVENLAWETPSTQLKKSWVYRKGRSSMQTSVTYVQVEGKPLGDDTPWVSYKSIKEAAIAVDTHDSLVRKVCQGEYKQANGYIFRYKSLEVLSGEEWRAVIISDAVNCGWKVSSLGRVENSYGVRSSGCGKKAIDSLRTYKHVNVNGKYVGVHQLVARAFIGAPPSNIHTVDHIDMNRSNNRVENLRWLSPAEQCRSSYATGNRKNQGKALTRPIAGRLLGEESWNLRYESTVAAAKSLGVCTGSILNNCKGKSQYVRNKATREKFEFIWPEESDLQGEEWRKIYVDELVPHKSNKLSGSD